AERSFGHTCVAVRLSYPAPPGARRGGTDVSLTLKKEGPLAFPITPMKADLTLDLARFEEHVSWMVERAAPALFVACGTGEFASLSVDEVVELTRVAVEVSEGVPVFVGAGQALPNAVACARQAEASG